MAASPRAGLEDKDPHRWVRSEGCAGRSVCFPSPTRQGSPKNCWGWLWAPVPREMQAPPPCHPTPATGIFFIFNIFKRLYKNIKNIWDCLFCLLAFALFCLGATTHIWWCQGLTASSRLRIAPAVLGIKPGSAVSKRQASKASGVACKAYDTNSLALQIRKLWTSSKFSRYWNLAE